MILDLWHLCEIILITKVASCSDPTCLVVWLQFQSFSLYNEPHVQELYRSADKSIYHQSTCLPRERGRSIKAEACRRDIALQPREFYDISPKPSFARLHQCEISSQQRASIGVFCEICLCVPEVEIYMAVFDCRLFQHICFLLGNANITLFVPCIL